MITFSSLDLSNVQRAENGFPYLVFWRDEFLPDTVDRALKSDFPDSLMLSRLGDRLAVNVDLCDGSPEVREFLSGSVIWREYVSAWTSSDQIKHLIDVFLSEIKERSVSPWKQLLWRRSLRIKRLEITVLLSVYRRGFQLAPHTDDKHKLISLIHYLPQANSDNIDSGGTNFYIPKIGTSRNHLRQFSEWSRGLRRYLPLSLAPVIEASLSRRYFDNENLDEVQRQQFDERFAAALNLKYVPNRISGFIKNDWSMHEVDLSDFPPNELRRAVLINLRILPSRFGNVIARLDVLGSRLKGFVLRRV
jgi:hypothetical protein